jgi:hypothetical protein
MRFFIKIRKANTMLQNIIIDNHIAKEPIAIENIIAKPHNINNKTCIYIITLNHKCQEILTLDSKKSPSNSTLAIGVGFSLTVSFVI